MGIYRDIARSAPGPAACLSIFFTKLEMTTTIAQLLQDHPYLKLLPSNRIKCEVTGHELPLKSEAIASHVSGKKFKKALEWYNYDFSEFLPHIVPHKSNPKKLFCLVTKQNLNRIPEEVKNHIRGKRFRRLKMEYEERSLKKKVKEVEEEEEPEFWMPDNEGGEGEKEDNEVEEEVEEEEEEDGEEDEVEGDVGEDEEEETEPRTIKRKAPSKIKSPTRKIIKVDDDFKIIKRVEKKKPHKEK